MRRNPITIHHPDFGHMTFSTVRELKEFQAEFGPSASQSVAPSQVTPPPPVSHPSTHATPADLKAIERVHEEIKQVVEPARTPAELLQRLGGGSAPSSTKEAEAEIAASAVEGLMAAKARQGRMSAQASSDRPSSKGIRPARDEKPFDALALSASQMAAEVDRFRGFMLGRVIGDFSFWATYCPSAIQAADAMNIQLYEQEMEAGRQAEAQGESQEAQRFYTAAKEHAGMNRRGVLEGKTSHRDVMRQLRMTNSQAVRILKDVKAAVPSEVWDKLTSGYTEGKWDAQRDWRPAYRQIVLDKMKELNLVCPTEAKPNRSRRVTQRRYEW